MYNFERTVLVISEQSLCIVSMYRASEIVTACECLLLTYSQEGVGHGQMMLQNQTPSSSSLPPPLSRVSYEYHAFAGKCVLMNVIQASIHSWLFA